MEKKFNYLILTFLIFIGVSTLFKLDLVKNLNENRRLQSFQEIQISKNYKKMFSSINNYVNDNYGFRKSFLLVHNLMMFHIFNTPPSREVIFGKDGWMFFQCGNIIERQRGLLRLTDLQIEKFINIQQERQDWFKSKGIEYFIVIAPNKGSIYPEYLPDWAKSVHEKDLDLLLTKLKNETELNVIDGEFLKNLKSKYEIYLPSETHWTDIAAFFVYQKLMKKIKEKIPETPDAFNLEDMNIIPQYRNGGDIPIYLGLLEKMYISNPLVRLKYEKNFKNVLSDGRTHTYANNSSNSYNIVVFPDSFGGAWTHYLPEHFNIVRWNQTYGIDLEDIKRYKPKVVISEYAERQLYGSMFIPNPKEMRKN